MKPPFDLPPIEVEVTEHQLIKRRCGCGVVTGGQAPAGVTAPVQYGSRITAIILYLHIGRFLSKDRTAKALAELFGIAVSGRTVLSMAERATGRLEGFLARACAEIAAAPVAHFDETGFRVEGRLHWVHSASTGTWSLITVHRKRGVEAMKAAGVLPGFRGVAVHDAWAPYDTYTEAEHALCNAHLLRELRYILDNSPADQEWCWAGQAAGALCEMKMLVDAALAAGGLEHLDQVALARQVRLFTGAAVIGTNDTKARSSKLMKKFHALATRMTVRQADYLRFTRDELVPFDNNAAEREIRMIKLRQKVSGCLRTLAGAEQFCAIRITPICKPGLRLRPYSRAGCIGRPPPPLRVRAYFLSHPLGETLTWNWGAGGDCPMRQALTSTAKNRCLSRVHSFSHWMTSTCSDLNDLATQTTVVGFVPTV